MPAEAEVTQGPRHGQLTVDPENAPVLYGPPGGLYPRSLDGAVGRVVCRVATPCRMHPGERRG